MTIRISLVTVLAMLAFAAIGAGGAVGVMLWEPWDGDDGEGGGMEHTLTGTVLLRQQTSVNHTRGDTCQGEGAYSYVRSGTQVLVKDSTGALLETGALEPGTIKLAFWAVTDIWGVVEQPAREHCEFSFQIPGIPEADFYSIEIGGKDPLTLSSRELETKAWTLQVELGY